jgi:TIR domain
LLELLSHHTTLDVKGPASGIPQERKWTGRDRGLDGPFRVGMANPVSAAAVWLGAMTDHHGASIMVLTLPTKVFISYSRRDRAFLERLQVFLRPLEQAGLVDRWDDTKLRTGARWRDEIKAALASARVAVLLVSADFIASDFITTEELPVLLAAEQKRGLIVMPVIVGPCRFARTPSLAQFQSLNDLAQPLAALPEAKQDEFWDKLVNEIEDTLRRP